MPLPEVKSVAAVEREQSDSSMVADGRYIVKILRRITAGVHPEIV
jgi:predicted trehalose synthase